MLALDDPRLQRHAVEFTPLTTAVWQVNKRPPFRSDFQHHAYVLAHPEGLILYDAPPLLTEEAIATIRALGTPRLLVVSHTDFVGFAGPWAHALGIPAWMGEGDEPLPGNCISPDERVSAPRRLASDLEVVPVPGHSPGSLAVYWSGAPEGPVLCCGDALAVWPHSDGRTQVAFFQKPPVGAALDELTRRPVSLLAACGGALHEPDKILERLRSETENCARPWRGDTGGVWL
jgi:glyoxylase-like metal-dependent hydrolase (beta-lactamase superfamily II)